MTLPSMTRWMWQSVVGFGVGIGLSLSIFGTPSVIKADLPQVVHTSGVRPEKLEISVTGQEWVLAETELLGVNWWESTLTPRYWQGSGQLGDSQPVVIIGRNTLPEFETLPELNLGTAIKVLGSNNLWYSYEVVEVRSLPVSKIPGWLSTLNQNLVLLVAHSAIEAEWLAVIAVPKL